jgi:hypothetical protein
MNFNGSIIEKQEINDPTKFKMWSKPPSPQGGKSNVYTFSADGLLTSNEK